MVMTTRTGPDTAISIGQHGLIAAKLLQHQDWQREAVRQSAVRHALGAGGGRPSSGEPLAARRLTSAIGDALVRVGMRLQGHPRPAAPNPAC